jgi:predicted dithiol-disulfide oxidoreductase (DUF899 family)
MSSQQPPHSEIMRLEKEIEERRGRLRELRRQSDPVVAEGRLQDAGGEVSLASLFGSKDELLLIHNMGARCPYCTLWADGFNGVVAHLEDRSAFVVCSPDAPDAQRSFAASRGWRFRMVSDLEGTFTRAMGYREERDGKVFHLPGVSAFRRDPDGKIRRTGHAPFGPGDPFCGIWHLFELFEGGAGGWEPKFRYVD